MKILIVKLSSIGDIIHTLPTLAAIRNQLPDAKISWAAETGAAEILRGNSMLDELIELDTRSLRRAGLRKLLPEAGRQFGALRKSQFDVCLDFQGLFKSAAIARISKTRKIYGFAKENLREPASRLLLNKTVSVEKKIHIIRKNLALAEKALRISVPEADFEFPIDTGEKHRLEAREIIEKTNENFVLLNPAGGWATKLWQAEKFGQLADKIYAEFGFASIVATAPNEIELAEKVRRGSSSGKIFLAQPSLKGFYELAKRAKLYVGGDTGPTFLAIAAKTPVVGIFGPTEWRRNGSPNPADICVERTDLACRVDCHRRTCNNWICLDIETEPVLQAVRERLKSDNSTDKKGGNDF